MWPLSDLLPCETQDEPAAHGESILAPAVTFKRSPIRVEGASVNFYLEPKQLDFLSAVDDEVIASALEGIDAGAERVRAEQLVERRLRRETLGDGDDAKVMRRLVAMLARRGYSQSMAVAVVTDAVAAERDRRKV